VVRQLEPIRGEYRSSIIVDPPSGRIPGNARFNAWQAGIQHHVLNAMDGPESRPASERCLGNPASQPPILYNPGMNLHQIVQTRETIVFYSEWGHDARVIRINGKHAPPQVTSWLGDSIGWWEGDTLVVETKNFAPSDPGRVVRSINYKISPQATVIERFKRVSATQLDYSFTVDDPVHYTQSWSGETHFLRSDESLFEYACHEGNYALANILRAARALEAEATALATSGDAEK